MREPVARAASSKTALSAPLSYAFFESPLGLIYAATEGPALVAISFCPGPEDLRGLLSKRLGPAVTLRFDSFALKALFRLLDSYFKGHAVDFSTLPVRVFGTAFDRSVWNALREIPQGEVRTYAEVAVAVGRPRAFRAVAGACGRNMIPLVIPCHRVICSDGSPGGWSGGGGRRLKEGLLEIEGRG